MSSLPTESTELPERSADQRRVALEEANRVRVQRAALKAELKRGGLSATTLIAKPPQCLASAKIAELLRALPGYGPVKVGRLLERCQVNPRKTVGGLSERRELIRALAG
jgi:hypothetical protein